MSMNLNEFLNALDDDPFEENPVDFETFVYGDDYLSQPVLSDIQRDLVEAMSQIFKMEDLKRFMGEEKGRIHYKKYTKAEVILQLGKGSGKDHTSTIGCAYLVYKLLCLKDPARYFGKPPGDAIDIINVAINSEQAKNVFFKGFKNKIARSPWFAGKYDAKANTIDFDKAVTVYSGHSERESHEGLNLILAILDEISGFAQESASGNENAKTGDAIYRAFRASVDSRFPDFGKVVLLSFPRYPGDFISKRYDEVVAEKEVESKTHTFIINEDLPPDDPSNNFTIEWEEDHIISYKYPGVFAIKRPTWEANPTRSIDDFKISFMTDYGDAMQRFACVPSFASDAFFKQKDKLERAMCLHNPVDSFKRLEPVFHPKEDVVYFLHADLAQKHDKCAIAISHVDKWVEVRTFNNYTQVHPFVIVDAIVWWEPKKEGPVDLSEVKNWIVNFRRDGYRIGLVTFDRWNSFDIQQELKSVGIKTDTLSVAKKHYEDLSMLVYEDRVLMPHIDILLEEMSQLRIISDKKVDHPRKGCFTGDTLIPLLDGTDQTMESLEGDDVWIYSYDIENNFVVPARGSVKKTWETSSLVRVVLDSGAVISCTPDHLFLLRSGVYKEAQYLRAGIDRIMPLKGNNHRVRSVTHIVTNADVPVYDLEVPIYHNFALAAGIFVHNSKDLSDAVTGAVYNAIAHTPRNTNLEIEIHDWKSSTKADIIKKKSNGVIEAPPAPKDVEDYLSGMGII